MYQYSCCIRIQTISKTVVKEEVAHARILIRNLITAFKTKNKF